MRHRGMRVALGLALSCAAAVSAVRADESGASPEELRREIDALKRKVEALERAQSSSAPAPTLAPKGTEAAPAAAGPSSEDEELRLLREEAAKEVEKAPEKPGATAAPAPAPGGATAGTTGGGLQQTLNAFNPRITVFGDFLGRLGLAEDELEEDDRVSVREVELDMRADVDPYAKAVLILAFEEEDPGSYVVDVEEGYATLETLPWNLRAQVGRYRQRMGQANRVHRHDLMWVEYPLMVRDLFGEEGLKADGLSLLWLAPGAPLELEATIMSGEDATILAGEESDFPAFLGRASFFTDLPARTQLTVGTSLLSGFNDDGTDNLTQVVSGDVLLTWRPTVLRSIAAISEVYYLDREVGDDLRSEYALGWYGALQFQPIQQLYIGARYDFSDYGEQIEDNDQWAGSVYASWYTTEFMRVRAGYEHRERRSTGFPGAEGDLDTLFLQVTFIFGSHPVEPFWVNR